MGTNHVTTADLQRQAIELGIDALGTCRAEHYEATEGHIAERADRGLFADLKFTMSRPESSCHPETLVDGALSVVSAALCYWTPDAAPAAPAPHGRIARYTRTDAYAALARRLDALADRLRGHGHDARVLVDANHHVDREAAARSGVGFYGKHTCLITRRHGSWVVLGTIVTTAPLAPTEPLRSGCGTCTACIDACPTGAIVDDGVLDARLCISYLTQSRHPIPPAARDAMHDMVYGCDLCQQACPWNRGVERRRAGHAPADGTVSLAEWLGERDDVLDARYERFFIPRRQVRFLRRNALVALGNTGSHGDAALVAPFLTSGDAMLRDHAEWALGKIGGPIAEAALATLATGAS